MGVARCSLRLLFIFGLLLSVVSSAQDPSVVGQWTAPADVPVRPIHTHLLPNGKVFFYSYYDEAKQPHIWDPETGQTTSAASIDYSLFCSGHSFLPNGDLLVTSGHITDYVGYKNSSIYHPFTNTWTTGLPLMNAGRWYPTNTALANGDILVTSGQIDTTVGNNPLPQVWQYKTNSWRDLTSAQLKLPLYPFMFLAPNGQVFNAGPTQLTRYLDTSGIGAWTTVGNSKWGYRSYGSAVMYDYGKVMIVGGGDPPTNTAEIIDLNAATPTWSYTAAMSVPRRQHTATILADGTVLVTGGSSGSGFDDSSAPVYAAQLWNPETGTWTTLASMTKYRGYHSTALLLPDGRVFSGGGNVGGPNIEIFSPPYLFKGTRPTIDSAPSQIAYNTTFTVSSAAAASISKVHLIRLASVTHSYNQDQRIARLQFTVGSGQLSVTAPANANLAPPGYYMLFVVDSTGVPSVAKIIHLNDSAQTGPTGTVTGFVYDQSGAPISGAAVTADSGATGTTAADGGYTLANVPAGAASLTASASGFAPAVVSVNVVSGQTVTAPNFNLAPSSGRGSFSGKVSDTNSGTPLSGATVSFSGGTTTTDASGNYSFTNIAAGTYQVTATRNGYLSRAQTLTLPADTNTTFDFQLSTAGKVTGTVKYSDGTVASAASVEIRSGDLSTVVTVSTNATGVYTSNWIAIGNYTLTASKAGYNSAQTTATVKTGQTTTAPLLILTAATGGASMSGRVYKVNTGEAIPNATIASSFGTTQSDAAGGYSFANVPSGGYTVTVSATGFLTRNFSVNVGTTALTQDFPLASAGILTGAVKSTSGTAIGGAAVKLSGGVLQTAYSFATNSSGVFNTGWMPIGNYTMQVTAGGYNAFNGTATVAEGQTTTVPDTILSPATATPGSISGKITNASSGAALSGATVSSSLGTKTTDSSGNYSYTNVGPGTYSITASKTGYLPRTLSATVPGGSAVTLNIPIATSGVISGTVKNSAGSVLAGVSVRVVGGVVRTDITKTTDSMGRFNTGWIPVGTYSLTFSRSGFATQTKTAGVSAGATTTVNVVMQ